MLALGGAACLARRATAVTFRVMRGVEAGSLIVVGVVLAFALLIAAVWASDAGVATSLALTGGIILVAVGAIAVLRPVPTPRGPDDEQRDRMKQTTP